MNLIQRLWKFISDQGIESADSIMVHARIRTLNRTAAIVIGMLLFYALINVFQGEVFIASSQLVLLIMVIVAIAINHFGMYHTALIFFMATLNLSILSQCWLLGAPSGNHYYFLLAALFPILATDRKDIISGLFILSGGLFIFTLVYLFEFTNPMFYVSYGSIFRIGNIIAVIVLLYLGLQHFKIQSVTYQQWMKEKSMAVQLQSNELEGQRDQLLELNEELKQQNDKIQQHRMRLEKSFWDIQMLSEIGKNITSKLSIPEIIDAIYEDLSLVMSVEVFILGIWDRRQEHLQVTELHRGIEKRYDNYTRDEEETFGVFAFNTMQHYVLNDFEVEAPEHNPAWRPMGEKLPAAAIYVPLMVNEEPFGMLSVSSPEKNVYSDHHLNILQNLAVFITNALENARIYSQLEVQKSEIERQNKDITDSITYASRIQKAVLDSSESILSQFEDAFIFYQPRDIVSGDFYWFHRREHRRYVVVADCTGHGVAGAFLTIMGVDFLNEIVIADPEHKQPHQILEELNDKFLWMTYRQANKSITDGMDVAVLVFDEEEQQVEFAGAKNNMWYVRDEEIHQVRGNHFSIGRGGPDLHTQFTSVTIPCQAGDRFY
ncbi:MAG TPA: hypothetical protein DCP28_36615, partial [Cytophagales bacterium]|nr:hypothetical protein [Cytophagales bacterium]